MEPFKKNHRKRMNNIKYFDLYKFKARAYNTPRTGMSRTKPPFVLINGVLEFYARYWNREQLSK